MAVQYQDFAAQFMGNGFERHAGKLEDGRVLQFGVHLDTAPGVNLGSGIDLDAIQLGGGEPTSWNVGQGDGFQSIGSLGRDANSSGVVFREDWQQIIRNVIVRSFRDQPKIVRRLATLNGNMLQSNLDGTTLMRIGQINDIDTPGHGMRPYENHTGLSLTEITHILPQIFQTASLPLDDWAQSAAGQDRWTMLNAEIVRNIQKQEDIDAFRGVTKLGTLGFIDTAASDSDLGAPTGAWGVDTGNNGILNNFRADVAAALDEFTINSLGDKPIDVVMTSYIYNLIKTNPFLHRSGDNLTWLKSVLNGGEIFVTNNLQASVSTTANSILFLARAPGTMQNWALIASGLESRMKEGLWDRTYGLREKFTIKVFNSDYVRWMDAISNATS